MLLQYLKRGAYNSICYASSSALIRTINLFLVPFFLNRLTLTEFGVWDFYQLWFSWLTLLMTSAFATAMTRFYLMYNDVARRQQEAIGNAFIMTGVVAGLLLVVGIPLIMIHNGCSPYILLTIINAALFSLTSMVITYCRIKEYLGYYMLVFCGQNCLAIGLTVFFMQSMHWGIYSFFYAQIIANLLFIPFFMNLLRKHWCFNAPLLYEQLWYAVPLLLHAIVCSFLMNIDRVVIWLGTGYELLGMYSLLARFGSIFQFFIIACVDAWPVVLYNAQKEKEGNRLIQKLITSFCMVIAFCCLCCIVGSVGIVNLFFPDRYLYLIQYIPAFFIPLFLVEIARLFQAGFTLATKTVWIPAILIAIGCLQMVFLYGGIACGLPGIFVAQALAYTVYILVSLIWSQKVYPHSIINIRLVGRIVAATLVTIGYMQCICWYKSSLGLVVTSIMVWPFLLWALNVFNKDRVFGWGQKLFWYFHQRWGIIPTDRNQSVKNILYLRTDICSDELKAGGSVAHTLGVIKALWQQGYTVYGASSAMPTLLQQTPALQRFIHLRIGNLLWFMRWKLGYARWRLECIFSNYIFLRQVQKSCGSLSWCFIYQRYSLLNCVGYLLRCYYKVPLILEYNGSEVWQFDQLAPKKWFKWNTIARLVEYTNVHGADYIVVVSQVLKEQLIAQGVTESKILVNPNGVDTDSFNPAVLVPLGQQLKSAYALPDCFVIGFVGTFSFWHGIEVIATMVEQVAACKAKIHFLLIGDGPLKSWFEQQIKANNREHLVTMTGFVAQERAKDYLAMCDAFISPTQPNKDGTRFFGSPTKIFEYLSMGKPIIASDLEQLSEIINPALRVSNEPWVVSDQVGILVDPRNTEEYVQAVLHLLQLSPEQRALLGHNARAKAVAQHSWLQHVQAIEQFVQHATKV